MAENKKVKLTRLNKDQLIKDLTCQIARNTKLTGLYEVAKHKLRNLNRRVLFLERKLKYLEKGVRKRNYSYLHKRFK